ncbi:PAS domain-containing hybrid sensor histidine kinase/response regulator [Hydrogenophaga sp. T2]|uniref:PAS domain-containing hybrid sensor histidine kinase/response regulator n=1 Tax=Hydrogenophaga sp. T2 TaxID=3132823 RepID=UPI003CFA5D0F
MPLHDARLLLWSLLPGRAALLSRTAAVLVCSRGWERQWPRTDGDWRQHLSDDSRCRLLDALSRPQDMDIALEIAGAQHRFGHWRCVGAWDPAMQAHACHVVDVTAQEQQRLDAHLMSERIHLLFDQLPMQVAYFGPPPAARCLFANDSFARWMGFERHEIVGKTAQEILQEEDRRWLESVIPAYGAGGENLMLAYSRRGPQGRLRHFEVSIAGDQDAQGRTCGFVVAMADVTERRLAEDSLRRSQERLARFLEISAEGVFFHRDGVITDANPAACRLLSLTHAELIGRSALSLPQDANRRWSHLRIHSGAETTIETQMLDGHGQAVPVELIGRSMTHQDERQRMTVLRDMRDRQAAQARIHTLIEDLRSQKDRAEAADRGKSVFLAAASHDLRQPIHAMGLFLSALRAMAQAPAVRQGELAEICRRMQSSLDSLGQLLNMLLDVSRLDANAVQVQLEPTPLEPLFAELEQEFTDLAREKGLRLHAAPCTAWVRTDATVLRRILSNLVANAVRYTQHGRILLGARRRPGHIEIQVFDSGIGIAPEQLDAIFEEFYQVGQSRAARDEAHGLGLGLSIVQRSARLLDAPLTVRSTLGRGSAFSITLPACDPAPLRPGAEAPAAPQPGQRNVLVIDDDEQVLMGMQQLLQVWGHRVWCAPSADQAVLLAIEHAADIDLLLSDYRLGGNTTAVQAIAAVHACLGRTVPTFILTGDTSPQRIQEASELGFPLLHKPVDANALLGTLAQRA